MNQVQDLTGKTFNHLKVIRRGEDKKYPSGKTVATWVCLCDCGNLEEINVVGYDLKRSHKKSCGKCQKHSSKTEKTNTYIERDDYYEVTTENGYFYIDKEDKEKIESYYWFFDQKGRVKARDRTNNKLLSLHRLIMNAQKRDIVDHIKHPVGNEHKIDNRKSNLRISTNQQNCFNQGIRKNNSSGITGVSWLEKNQKWRASITVNYKTIYLGMFLSKEEAAQARKEAEEKYFKEFQYSKFN